MNFGMLTASKILLLAMLPLVLHAHEDSDWREDYEAYLSVHYERPLVFKSLRSFQQESVDMAFFREKLQGFVQGERKSEAGVHRARLYLKEEFTKLGFEVILHPFGSGTNFIAEKKGTTSPEKVLIISSHIDTVGNAGANDNGTGTIGALTLARELAKRDHAKTLRIIGFDREERGIAGSDAYVASLLNKQSIIGNINIEMIGFHSKNDGAFHVIDCDKNLLGRRVTRTESLFLSQAVKDSILNQGLELRIAKTCTSRSDHGSFWRHDLPAIAISENFFGGDPDPCYHSSCDVMDERLNYDYIEKILRALLGASKKLLN